MVSSIYQIDFTETVGGATTRLLAAGEMADATLQFGWDQSTTEWQPVGLDYGLAAGLGGARHTLEWQRMHDHASHAAAASFAISHPLAIPKQKAGKLRLVITGGSTWDLLDAVIVSVNSRQLVGRGFRTMTGYRVTVGKPVFIS